MYDVAIIGGGHNGLTCAAYLARAGHRVVVLESRQVVGGFCTTEETVAEAPGFRMNPTSMDQVFTNVAPSVVTELNLAKYGLRYLTPDPMYSYLCPNGGTIDFCQEVSRTVESIRRLSRKDAVSYERLNTLMTDLWRAIMPYVQGHPTRVSPSAVVQIVRQAAKSRRSLGAAAHILAASPAQVIEEWFECDELKAALACYAAASMAPLDEPGTGLVLSILAVMHTWGLRRPIGGNGAFTEALADCVTDHGGEILKDAAVAQVLIERGQAAGVVGANGGVVRARHVIAAINPVTVMESMVEEEYIPEKLAAELRGLVALHTNISVFKGDVALSRRPHLPGVTDQDPILASVMLMAPSLDYVRRSVAGAQSGDITDEIPLWLGIPSILDRTLVSPDSKGETLYVYAPAVPLELRPPNQWEQEKDKYLIRCLQIFEDYVPGVQESIIGTRATSPLDLGEFSTGHGMGHPFHKVDAIPSQLGPWRPTKSLSGYRTPVAGLWHTGAAAHPMGILSGWSGRTAARTVSRALG